MGNVSVKDGESGSDSEMMMMMRGVSSSMVVEAAAMAFTPPDTSPSIITPQIPQAPLYHVDEPRRPWSCQLQNSNDDGQPETTIATLIEWNHGGSDISVEGSWDNWSTRSPLHRASKDFALVKLLPAGVYHYKFLVNGEWRHSPDLPCIYDEKGNGINILEVQNYVPENLDGIAEFDAPSSPESSYDSPYPGPEDFSKDPPLLPSQLHLNTQLESFHHQLLSSTPNLDAGNSTLPQHVILNHLFVESRKAVSSTPVLALGFTQRFRTKYVTVILHKPLQR